MFLLCLVAGVGLISRALGHGLFGWYLNPALCMSLAEFVVWWVRFRWQQFIKYKGVSVTTSLNYAPRENEALQTILKYLLICTKRHSYSTAD